jgi:integrase
MATYVVRTLKSGLKKVKVMVRRKNAPCLTQTFRTRRDAEAWAMSIEGELLSGQSSPRVEATLHTLADTIQRYKEVELSRKKRKHNDQVAQLDWWVKELGHLKLAQLNGPVICTCRDKLASGITVQGKPRQPATVNRYLAALSHVLSVATRDWGWMPESPMYRVRKFKEPLGRVEFLSDVQRNSLLNAATSATDPHLYLIIVLAIATGMRRGEITGLRWENIDWERRRIILLKTKNGERRAVPLPEAALTHLRERFHGPENLHDLLFPSTKEGFEGRPWDFTRAWKRALKSANIENFRFHDLRHSCASYLAMNGATTAEIAEVLGHKTLQMVRRYAHLSDSHVANLVNRVAITIFGKET